MSKESSKSLKRRILEHNAGGFQWLNVFKGEGIDIGCGDDPLPFEGCKPFDQEQGDANNLSEYFPSESQDYLHASHVLEHMLDPMDAILDWMKVLKPGGYLVVTVPDVGAYECFTYPSKHNPDHRSSWSMVYGGSAFPIHIHIPKFLHELEDNAETVLCRYVERNFDWNRMDIDQTFDPTNETEIWNEFVLVKR